MDRTFHAGLEWVARNRPEIAGRLGRFRYVFESVLIHDDNRSF
jgi:hypothetical protein